MSARWSRIDHGQRPVNASAVNSDIHESRAWVSAPNASRRITLQRLGVLNSVGRPAPRTCPAAPGGPGLPRCTRSRQSSGQESVYNCAALPEVIAVLFEYDLMVTSIWMGSIIDVLDSGRGVLIYIAILSGRPVITATRIVEGRPVEASDPTVEPG